jgi:hypothetical protein
LLVSHWEVNTGATVELITKAVAELKSNAKVGRAEALRRAMLAMIAAGPDDEAYPAFWPRSCWSGKDRESEVYFTLSPLFGRTFPVHLACRIVMARNQSGVPAVVNERPSTSSA